MKSLLSIHETLRKYLSTGCDERIYLNDEGLVRYWIDLMDTSIINRGSCTCSPLSEESKKDLFLSLIDHWEIYTFKDFYKKTSNNKTASDTLRFFGQNVLKTLENKKYAYIAEVEFWALSNQDKEIKERSQLLYDKLLNLFEKVVEKGIKNKEFKDLNIRKTAMVILAVFQGINWFVIFNEKLISPKEYIENSIEIIINSISK